MAQHAPPDTHNGGPPTGPPLIGSLFSGYLGLDMAVQAVFGGTLAWVSDIDPGACKILAHRAPGVPNIGDITAVDWRAVERVDVLSGGFPCQDLSHAGKRAGMRPGTRSGLWSHMAYAVDQLRPRYVIAENVRGLLSGEAHSDVEPCPWCLGDGTGEPALRALGAVLGDLADLGYDARWHGLRAADVGAPHGRFRVFVVATDADQERLGTERTGLRRTSGLLTTPRLAAPTTDPADERHERTRRARDGRRGLADSGVTPAHASGARLGQYPREPPTEEARAHAGNQPASDGARGIASDADYGTHDGQRPCAEPRGGSSATADADRAGLRSVGRLEHVRRDPDGCRSADIAWGTYEPAIRRWERILGRPAPAPTQPGRTGNPQLSPAFVEWLMGLPAGWVTDVPGLTRNAMLKALGNGVVPQQASAALRHLLAIGRAA